MPKSREERQLKLATDVMNQDREALRALASRAEHMPAISVEKTDSSTSQVSRPRDGSSQYDDRLERD
jgi:chorismate mutase